MPRLSAHLSDTLCYKIVKGSRTPPKRDLAVVALERDAASFFDFFRRLRTTLLRTLLGRLPLFTQFQCDASPRPETPNVVFVDAFSAAASMAEDGRTLEYRWVLAGLSELWFGQRLGKGAEGGFEDTTKA